MGRRRHRARPSETIKVLLAPLATPEVAQAAIGRLIEEWAALTYASMVEAAMTSQAANQPMDPNDDTACVVQAGAVGGA